MLHIDSSFVFMLTRPTRCQGWNSPAHDSVIVLRFGDLESQEPPLNPFLCLFRGLEVINDHLFMSVFSDALRELGFVAPVMPEQPDRKSVV